MSDKQDESLKLNLLGPITEAAGKTLQDAWELVFGGFGTYVEKKRLTRKKALQDFKASLEDKVNCIPEKHLCDPPLSIVGPALEASKYYFEEDEIREMFASVISASMDSRKASQVHPAFPIIIQQMSTLDAQNLECFHKADGLLPLCQYQLKKTDGKHDNFLEFLPTEVLQTNVFLSNPQASSRRQTATSITSLSRLGLIEINYESNVIGADYSAFEKVPMYRALLDEYKDDTQHFLYIQAGLAELTPLGKALCSIWFFSENL